MSTARDPIDRPFLIFVVILGIALVGLFVTIFPH
jgi:hypothetical protein